MDLPNLTHSALLVAVPESHGRPRLASVRDEVRDIDKILSDHISVVSLVSGASDSTITIKDALNEILRASLVHFACHGVQDLEQSLQSGFCLSDQRLTIMQLLQIRLPRAFMAFLSACETAMGDREQPDEAVHLSSALLHCGFVSVIGTLWYGNIHPAAVNSSLTRDMGFRSMHDQDGPLLARFFYEELIQSQRIEIADVPYALDKSVQKLRALGLPPHRWAQFIHLGA
jgi:hypothetical protein